MSTAIGQEQDYRDVFESESRRRNLYDEVVEILQELSDTYAVKGVYKYGKPSQMAFYLRHAVCQETGITDQNEALEIVMSFLEKEVADKRTLGEDGYLAARGLKTRQQSVAEILGISNGDEKEAEYNAEQDEYLGNNLIRMIKRQASELHIKKIFGLSDLQKSALPTTGEDEAHQRVLDELDKLIEKGKVIAERQSKAIQKGVSDYKRQKKNSEALANKIRRGYQALLKKQKARVGAKNMIRLIDSREGQQLLKELHANAKRISLATRMSMGQQVRQTPTQKDEAVAQKVIEAFVRSGSTSKANIAKHMWMAKNEAAEVVRKTTNNEKLKTAKNPSYYKVRKQLKLMNLDIDVAKEAMMAIYNPSKKNSMSKLKKSDMDEAIKIINKAKGFIKSKPSEIKKLVAEKGREIKAAIQASREIEEKGEAGRKSSPRPQEANKDAIKERLKSKEGQQKLKELRERLKGMKKSNDPDINI